MNINKPSLFCSRSPDKNKYFTALKSPKLDKSDFILLSVQILRNVLGNSINDELSHIQHLYISGNYMEAVINIKRICYLYRSMHEPLNKIISAAMRDFTDNPEKNYSRRYFETCLSHDVIGTFDENVFKSVGLMAQLMSEMNHAYKPKTKIETSQELNDIISLIHGFGDDTPLMVKNRNKLKNLVRDYVRKDRGKIKIDISHETLFSCNAGIMKSVQPNNAPYLTMVQSNRIVDLFEIDYSKDGYSANKKTRPFVNSASGTIFSMVLLLEQFIIRHKSDPDLQQNILNIVKTYINFACFNGFHSLEETMDMLYHPALQFVMAQYMLKLQIRFPEDSINRAISKATDYAATLCLKEMMHQELLDKITPDNNIYSCKI